MNFQLTLLAIVLLTLFSFGNSLSVSDLDSETILYNGKLTKKKLQIIILIHLFYFIGECVDSACNTACKSEGYKKGKCYRGNCWCSNNNKK